MSKGGGKAGVTFHTLLPLTHHPASSRCLHRYPDLCGNRCDKTPLQFELTHTYQIQSSCTGPTFSGRVSRPCSAKATPEYCGRTDNCANTWLAPGYCKDKTMAVRPCPQLQGRHAAGRGRGGPVPLYALRWMPVDASNPTALCLRKRVPTTGVPTVHGWRAVAASYGGFSGKLAQSGLEAPGRWLGGKLLRWRAAVVTPAHGCCHTLTTPANLRAG